MTDADIQVIRKKLAVATQAMQQEALVKDTDGGERGGKVMKYATLNSVLELVKKHLEAQNLVMTQPFEARDDGWQVINTLIVDKTDGNFLMFPGPQMRVLNDPQASGSAITYNRRYSLVTLFCLEQDDDDGGQAHRRAAQPNQRTEAETQTRAIIATLTDEDRQKFVTDFKTEFGSTLNDLPESRHGDALGYTKWWVEGASAEETAEVLADAETEAGGA